MQQTDRQTEKERDREKIYFILSHRVSWVNEASLH